MQEDVFGFLSLVPGFRPGTREYENNFVGRILVRLARSIRELFPPLLARQSGGDGNYVAKSFGFPACRLSLH